MQVAQKRVQMRCADACMCSLMQAASAPSADEAEDEAAVAIVCERGVSLLCSLEAAPRCVALSDG
jgi:hypothetical protein